jgi:hypothetical protein
LVRRQRVPALASHDKTLVLDKEAPTWIADLSDLEPQHVPVYRAERSRSWTAISTLPPLEYPGHFEVRLVSRNSGIRWKRHWVCVTHSLAGEYVGLEEVDDGLWDVYFGPLKLGRMDERTLRVEDHKGRLVRKQVSPMSSD